MLSGKFASFHTQEVAGRHFATMLLQFLANVNLLLLLLLLLLFYDVYLFIVARNYSWTG